MQIPTDHFESQLQRLGRDMTGAVVITHFWQGDDYQLQLMWRDGFFASVGFGNEASKLIAHRLTS
jgi:hypothetical protein